jgi:hypothetical protein
MRTAVMLDSTEFDAKRSCVIASALKSGVANDSLGSQPHERTKGENIILSASLTTRRSACDVKADFNIALSC